MIEQTKQQIAALKLTGMLEAFNEQVDNTPHQLSFDERLSMLVDREYRHRQNQKLKNRLARAKLKSGCSIEQIDYRQARQLNKQQILNLAKGHWIEQYRSILITGPTGTGKTYLSQAFAHKACLLGFTARYYRLLHLLHDSVIVAREGKLQLFLTKINKFNVLIIDDFGMLAMNDEQKRLLLEIIEHRYEKQPTIITSQLPVSSWYEYIDDPLIADALLDRIIHNSEKIALTGESIRKTKHQAVNEQV